MPRDRADHSSFVFYSYLRVGESGELNTSMLLLQNVGCVRRSDLLVLGNSSWTPSSCMAVLEMERRADFEAALEDVDLCHCPKSLGSLIVCKHDLSLKPEFSI